MKNFFKKLFRYHAEESRQDQVKSFNAEQAAEEDVEFVDRGLKYVRLDDIVGSVGRYKDFDNRFHLKNREGNERFQGIKNAMIGKKPMPPVKLYQIRNDYYILDGNHRVAAAKEIGRDEIEAKVTEVLSSKNTFENLLYRERLEFYEKTGLTGDITLTEVGKYRYLENQIKRHMEYLNNTCGKDVDLKKAAEDWYNTIYLPLVSIIKNGRLIGHFPQRTFSDLYAYVTFHHWDRKSDRKYGIGISKLIPADMETFRDEMLERSRPEYPEMKRAITAFILINAEPSAKESKLVDRIFRLEGIQEVHSVHGTIDIIAKITLNRDLLASDAEVIAEYVEKQIRTIPGISSTQTVIPGISREKDRIGNLLC